MKYFRGIQGENMKIEYYNRFNNDVVYYIFCYMIFISVFIIDINLVNVNMKLSLIILLVLSIVSIILLTNIRRYSIYRYDALYFLILFESFSFYYLFTALNRIITSNVINETTLVLTLIILLNIAIYIISILKISKLSLLGNYRVFYIIISYIIMNILIIFSFSLLMGIINNNSKIEYINKSFRYNTVNNSYTIINKDSLLNDYLGLTTRQQYNLYDIAVKNSYTNEEVDKYIESRFNIVNRVEDFIIFCGENYLSYYTDTYVISGSSIKLYVLFLKSTFWLILLVTMVSLCDLYKLRTHEQL